ncbi:FadR/GntR family transcriptional regulator [Actinomadura viridis]|uniref:FadR/GntR family transcriptional regulator n=1 Tax=Actinomadura viridis TaxID=58110 RepID=UPI003685A3D8
MTGDRATATPRSDSQKEAAALPRDVFPDERSFRFHPIAGARAFEEVIDQIGFALRAGVYREGDRLPNIDELAEALQVSRATVGEAIKVLASSGIVRAVRGAKGGLEVLSTVVPPHLIASTTPGWRRVARRHLVEGRRPIENEIALLAARRGTDEDFARLEASLADMARARDDDDLLGYVNADHRFHYVLGQAARNPVLADFQHRVLTELVILMESSADEFEQAGEMIRLHAALIEELRAGKEERVLGAMRALLDLVPE